MKKIPVKHIGYRALCSARHFPNSIHRIDLGSDRYRQLGVKERFKDEDPYRVCKKCLAAVIANEEGRRRATWLRRVDSRAKNG